VIGHPGRLFPGLESGAVRHPRLVLLRAMDHVGLNQELTAHHQDTRELSQNFMGKNQTLLVSLLPPGIGKVEVRDGDTLIGEARQSELHVFGEYPTSVRKASLFQSFIDNRRPLAPNLQPHDANT
jgi:hypothetical protein